MHAQPQESKQVVKITVPSKLALPSHPTGAAAYDPESMRIFGESVWNKLHANGWAPWLATCLTVETVEAQFVNQLCANIVLAHSVLVGAVFESISLNTAYNSIRDEITAAAKVDGLPSHLDGVRLVYAMVNRLVPRGQIDEDGDATAAYAEFTALSLCPMDDGMSTAEFDKREGECDAKATIAQWYKPPESHDRAVMLKSSMPPSLRSRANIIFSEEMAAQGGRISDYFAFRARLRSLFRADDSSRRLRALGSSLSSASRPTAKARVALMPPAASAS
jgi:hypothetical protein